MVTQKAKSGVNAAKHVFLNRPTPASFSFIFGLFQTNVDIIFTMNQCEKMSNQYTAPGFKPTTLRS